MYQDTCENEKFLYDEEPSTGFRSFATNLQ